MTARKNIRAVSAEDAAIRKAFKVGEAAWLLGLSYDVTLALVNSGELGARRVGKYHVIPKAEIDRYLAPAVQASADKRSA